MFKYLCSIQRDTEALADQPPLVVRRTSSGSCSSSTRCLLRPIHFLSRRFPFSPSGTMGQTISIVRSFGVFGPSPLLRAQPIHCSSRGLCKQNFDQAGPSGLAFLSSLFYIVCPGFRHCKSYSKKNKKIPLSFLYPSPLCRIVSLPSAVVPSCGSYTPKILG